MFRNDLAANAKVIKGEAALMHIVCGDNAWIKHIAIEMHIDRTASYRGAKFGNQFAIRRTCGMPYRSISSCS